MEKVDSQYLNDDSEEVSVTRLTEERLRLEREALAVERERLAAVRANVEAQVRLAQASPKKLAVAAAVFFSMLCFAGGLLVGIAVMENRQQRQREERLAKALSQLDDIAAENARTNKPSSSANSSSGAHPNVSVVVIQ